MKTLYITIVTLLLSSLLLSQEYAYNNYETKVYSQSNTISSFTVQVLDDTDFQYRSFLKESKDSKAIYRLRSERVSQSDLVKILRKVRKHSETIDQFETILSNEYPRLFNQLDQREISSLYSKFGRGSLSVYTNSLPSVL